MSRIRCIGFDVDGTMMDSWETNLAAANMALETLGCPRLDEEAFRIYFGLSGDDTGQALYPQDPKEFFEQTMKAQDAFTIRLKLFENMREILYTLKEQEYDLAVITGRTRQEYENDFSSFGLDGLFSQIITADDTEKAKPDPAPLAHWLQSTGADADEVVYIGDTFNDYASAQSAGVPFVLAGWGAVDPNIPAKTVLQKPDEIFSLLESQN